MGTAPRSGQALSVGGELSTVATGTMGVFQTSGPNTTAGDYSWATQVSVNSGIGGGNKVHQLSGLRRFAAAGGFENTKWHDGIGVDSSYLVPGSTSRSWWERDPYLNTHAWGGSAITYMTLTSTGLGIGTTSPSAKLDVRASAAGIALVVSDSVTNLSDKMGRISAAHYDNSEEPLALITGYTRAGSSGVMVGGGSGVMNAATYISFYTAAATNTLTGTEHMRIDGGGNVGINYTTPSVNLHIASTSAGLLTTPLALHNISNTTATAVQFRLLNSASADALNSVTNGAVDFKNTRDSTGAADLSFLLSPGGGVAPTTKFTIKGASGNVGIGTTTPGAALDVTSGAYTLLWGADLDSTSRTVNARKVARIGSPSYDNGSTFVNTLLVDNDGTNNIINMGGGSGVMLQQRQLSNSLLLVLVSQRLRGTERLFN